MRRTDQWSTGKFPGFIGRYVASVYSDSISFVWRQTMKKTLSAAGLFISLFAVGAYAESWNGTISEEHCGAKHAAATAADQKCIEKCMQGGAAPVFVSGDKVYKIDNPDAVKGHEGHKVTVTGKMEGDSIHVDSVKM